MLCHKIKTSQIRDKQLGTDPQGNEAVWFLNIVDYLVLFFLNILSELI